MPVAPLSSSAAPPRTADRVARLGSATGRRGCEWRNRSSSTSARHRPRTVHSLSAGVPAFPTAATTAPRDLTPHGEVFFKVRPDHDSIRARLQCLEHRHRAAHAVDARDIAGGGNHPAHAATDDDRLRCEFWAITLLHACVEGAAVHVRDVRSNSSGCRRIRLPSQAGQPAGDDGAPSAARQQSRHSAGTISRRARAACAYVRHAGPA